MIDEQLKERVLALGMEMPTAKELELINQFNSGKNFLISGVNQNELNQLLCIYGISKVNVPTEGSPRLLFISNTNQEAVRLGKQWTHLIKMHDVTVDLANDKGNMLLQRNDIFDGTEVIIGNCKRIHDLYIQNGINFNMLKYVIVDQLEDILKHQGIPQMKRLFESLPKCQIIITCNFKNSRIQKFIEEDLHDFISLDWEK